MSLPTTLLLFILPSVVTAQICTTAYKGGSINRVPFWKPEKGPRAKYWNLTEIPHSSLPFVTTTGYEVNAGHIGFNEFARPDILRSIDKAAKPWASGTVGRFNLFLDPNIAAIVTYYVILTLYLLFFVLLLIDMYCHILFLSSFCIILFFIVIFFVVIG